MILGHSSAMAKASHEVCADSVNAEVKEYAEEEECARQWLLKQFSEQGVQNNNLSLVMKYKDEGFLYFEDSRNNCFCIVANKELWPLLYGPVLAYSTENALRLSPTQFLGVNYTNLVKPFRYQIAALKNNSATPRPAVQPLYLPKNSEVQPMLAWNRWNQGDPYNIYSPTKNDRKMIIGCVPTAIAMAMSYYQWPERGDGLCYYKVDDKTIATIDFSKCAPQWKSYKSYYAPKDSLDEVVQNLSKLMVFIGLSVNSSFSDHGTTASLSNIKRTLCNHLGYSGHATFYKDITDDQIEALLYKELDESRPCIVSLHGHAFVCDGYKDGFFHYNLGWAGHYNGYYRLRIGDYQKPENGETLTLVKSMVCGIEPQRSDSSTVREIKMKKAGTLEELLTDEEKENITKLTIKGPINARDIKLLRKMAGAHDEFSIDGWRGGALRKLDLREAKIKTSKIPYYTRPASGTYSRTVNNRKYSFEFSKLTKSEWLTFNEKIGYSLEDMKITRTDDDKYFQNYYCQDYTIGQYMFTNCSSLISLVLPVNIERVNRCAFQDCTSLKSIVFPPSTEVIESDPFRGCISLEEVLIPRYARVREDHFCDHCSPIFRAVTRY